MTVWIYDRGEDLNVFALTLREGQTVMRTMLVISVLAAGTAAIAGSAFPVSHRRLSSNINRDPAAAERPRPQHE